MSVIMCQIDMKFAECINVPKGTKPFELSDLWVNYIFSLKLFPFFLFFENHSVSTSHRKNRISSIHRAPFHPNTHTRKTLPTR